jgi:hypothetical protein
LPISAIEAISPAIEHTRKQLLLPFRFGQWMRLAFVGLLAGELSSGGGCSMPRFPSGSHGGAGQLPGWGSFDPALFAGLIAILIFSALVLGIVFMYISSVMRFILFDSVLAKECHVRDGWNGRQGPGWRYFVWKLLYALATFAALVILIGIPAFFAFALGWFTHPKEHVVPLVLAGIALFFLFGLFFIATAVVYVLTKDFVVPQMALENIGAMEGWRRLWSMMKTEKTSYIGYIGMKILLAIGAGIIFGIIGLVFALIFLVPVAGVAIGAIFAGKAAGLGWNAGTITLAIVAGSVLLAIFFFLTSLLSVPVIVFFPAYSIYFFAGRYPALNALLYPAPAAQFPPLVAPPPYQLPSLPPEPEPIG